MMVMVSMVSVVSVVSTGATASATAAAVAAVAAACRARRRGRGDPMHGGERGGDCGHDDARVDVMAGNEQTAAAATATANRDIVATCVNGQ